MGSNVLLGYPDDIITQEHLKDVDFTTSKIGGQPDWIHPGPPTNTELNCSICSGPTSLIVQIYAPLENSNYHRTLYVFACTEQNCWNQTKSWKCLRGQKQFLAKLNTATPQESNILENKATDWIADADDWGSDDDIISNDIQHSMEQDSYENANIMINMSHLSLSSEKEHQSEQLYLQSNSAPLNNSDISPSTPVDINRLAGQDLNANPSSESSGAVGGESWSEELATAEIEVEANENSQGKEDLVAMESPDMDVCDLNNALTSNILKYFSPEELATCSTKKCEIDNRNPQANVNDYSQRNSFHQNSKLEVPKYFVPYFLAVDEELAIESDHYSDHELQLLKEYRSKEVENDDSNYDSKKESKHTKNKSKSAAVSQSSSDGYEKSAPRHGDILLHKMISTIKRNPGQVLRYTRDRCQKPLFMAKPSGNEIPMSCIHCNGPLICELQLLSSLIPFLKSKTSQRNEPNKENDCQNNEQKFRNLNKVESVCESVSLESNSCIEFGTIMIYTCQNSCYSHEQSTSTLPSAVQGNYYKEQIFLQSESL